MCKQTKPLNDFYSNPSGTKGRATYCKPCSRKYASRRIMPPEMREKRRAYMRQWSKSPEQKKRMRQWREANRETIREKARQYTAVRLANGKMAAYRKTPRFLLMQGAAMMVRGALGLGLITKQPCAQCSNPHSNAHHEDYSRPFAVEWLCKNCHATHHAHLRAKGIIVSARVPK